MAWFAGLVGVLCIVVAGVGVAVVGEPDVSAVSSIRGEPIELYGEGLYRFDTVFQVANNRSSDLVMLFVGLPLLALSLRFALRGSIRGRLLLLGTLGFFAYVSAGYALGALAYNGMFLAYVAFFAASLFAFVATFASCVSREQTVDGLPRRGPGVFMLVSGLAVLANWLMAPIEALASGEAPTGLDTYTTLFTHAFDMAVIAPATIAAGVLILRRRWLGYVTALSLLVIEAMLLPLISLATFLQIDLGITFTTAEIVGPIASFALLAALAVWVTVAVLRRVSDRDESEGFSAA